jgi:hypothetical protein
MKARKFWPGISSQACWVNIRRDWVATWGKGRRNSHSKSTGEFATFCNMVKKKSLAMSFRLSISTKLVIKWRLFIRNSSGAPDNGEGLADKDSSQSGQHALPLLAHRRQIAANATKGSRLGFTAKGPAIFCCSLTIRRPRSTVVAIFANCSSTSFR